VPIRQHVAAVTAAVAVTFSPVLPQAPKSPLCDSGSYRKAHPLICDTGNGTPGAFPGSGGGTSSGGLLGAIGGLLGGLTGGLL
jgi:hypothetical protein